MDGVVPGHSSQGSSIGREPYPAHHVAMFADPGDSPAGEIPKVNGIVLGFAFRANQLLTAAYGDQSRPSRSQYFTIGGESQGIVPVDERIPFTKYLQGPHIPKTKI